MIKQTLIAAIAATSISGAVALEDRNNINLNYSDEGSYYTNFNDFDDDFDSSAVALTLDGRNGIVEYGAAINEDSFTNLNVGVALPVAKGFGVVAGVALDDKTMSTADAEEYYGVIYENAKFEGRYTYQSDVEDHAVSGRYYLTSKFGINAGVSFEDFDEIGNDSTYTVGVSYKF